MSSGMSRTCRSIYVNLRDNQTQSKKYTSPLQWQFVQQLEREQYSATLACKISWHMLCARTESELETRRESLARVLHPGRICTSHLVLNQTQSRLPDGSGARRA